MKKKATFSSQLQRIKVTDLFLKASTGNKNPKGGFKQAQKKESFSLSDDPLLDISNKAKNARLSKKKKRETKASQLPSIILDEWIQIEFFSICSTRLSSTHLDIG